MPKKKEEDLKEETVQTSEEAITEEKPTIEPSEVTTEQPEPIFAAADSVEKVSHSTEEEDEEKTVTVQPVKFASFEELNQVQGETNKNLDILMDIKLQLTVELGRTELPIKKVLELTRGSIIELEKVAGEPVELYANGKLVAHGEVVVIEDNFGLRITSITEPEDILKGI